jgi:cytidylate kinase
MSIITISKEYGTGATTLAYLLAKTLEYHYVDKLLVMEVARRLQVNPEEVEEWDMESHSEWKAFLSKYFDIHPFKGGFEFQSLSKETDKPATYIPGFIDTTIYQKMTHKLILELAERDNVVIVGRGSQSILGERPNAFHFRVVRPLEERVKHIMEVRGLSKNSAESLIRDADRRSRQYVRHYYDIDSEDPHNYHLVLNTGRLSIEEAADSIISCMERLTAAPS